MMTLRIRRQDRVKVLSGHDKGKEGEVLRMLPQKGKALVKGVHIVKRHLKAREGQKAGILESERPIAVSKLGLVCKNCHKATRVGFRFESDHKVRFCKECQNLL